MTITQLDGHNLTLDQAEQVVLLNGKVAVKPGAQERVNSSRKVVDETVKAQVPVYGINTGVGLLSNRLINRENLKALQSNIILSHAVGVGPPLSEEAVRAMLLFRINSLVRGRSGIRMKVIDYLVDLLNQGVHPSIPAQGSVGASGDLAPLAHMALVLLGDGSATYRGKRIDGITALSLINRKPLELEPKEGLALVNGTQYMSALGFLCYTRGTQLLKNAICAAAMSLQAIRGFSGFLDRRIHEERPHQGQARIAELMRSILSGSELLDSTEDDVQDHYSFRCIPQVLGPALESLASLKDKLHTEINAVTDNPIVFPNGEIISGGNFHGQVLGSAIETATTCLAETGAISERRTNTLLTATERGLPLFLIQENGTNSGMMLTQYTAAALVAENKGLCYPAIVNSIPTSGGKEDHNSMASISARKAQQLIDNLENIIAIEYLCAAQAIDFQDPEGLSKRSKSFQDRIRKVVEHLDKDRFLSPDINRIAEAVRSGELINDII